MAAEKGAGGITRKNPVASDAPWIALGQRDS